METEQRVPEAHEAAGPLPPLGAQPGAPQGWLHLGGPSPRVFPLRQPLTRIGRSDHEANYAPDLDLRADDAVSRYHLEIHQTGDTFQVTDCGSTNGTLLNGMLLPPHQPHLLQPGAEIALGG